MPGELPYKIAVLCYLFDARGRVLLLHRRKPPNRDLYSPVGGKLDQASGESPAACALREIAEETGLSVRSGDLHLTGIVSEAGYRAAGEDDHASHWLMFLYEVTAPVDLTCTTFEEGRLEWHEPASIADLPIPETDRLIIWPLFWKYRGRFFSVHIDCAEEGLRWRLEQPSAEAGAIRLAAEPAADLRKPEPV
jgi:8-oxo-dGTP diphosphatase